MILLHELFNLKESIILAKVLLYFVTFANFTTLNILINLYNLYSLAILANLCAPPPSSSAPASDYSNTYVGKQATTSIAKAPKT